ncbi:MAG: ABC transporter ATP-binding protein [Bacteroidales bacterium]|nr:ABC transporter ATP-binding protein [Bacteroidales bacterium]
MTQKGNILLDIKGMTIGHRDRTLYSGVDIEIRESECIMLCGANGSGKTTLLKALAGMKGEGAEMKGKEIIMIPTRIPKVEGFTLREFIRISCFSQSDFAGRLSPEQESRIDQALETLGLQHLAQQDISTLSDGEFQKGSIAAALVRKAAIILLDEPTAFLDAENRINVLKTLKHLCSTPEKPAVIFSTHDLHDGLAVCDKVVALGSDGIVRTSKTDLKETVKTIFKDKQNDNQI